MKVHLVYPHRRVGTTPDAIGWQLADRLSQESEVCLYDWTRTDKIKPSRGDVLIGHPHPAPFTILRRSWYEPSWSRRYLLCPMIPNIHTVGFLDDLVRTCDSFFAFMGVPWYESIEFSVFRDWLPKIVRLDLGVDLRSYPQIKMDFAPQGRRALLYVGNTSPAKGIDYLASLARARPSWSFGWIGQGDTIPGFQVHGFMPTDEPQARAIATQYDFFLSTGTADANPTTVLESMAWGLIPFTTRTAGYDQRDGVVPLPLNSGDGASLIDAYQEMHVADLLKIQADNFQRLNSRFSWNSVVETISSDVIGGVSRVARTTGAPERLQMQIGKYTAPNLYASIWRQMKSLRRI